MPNAPSRKQRRRVFDDDEIEAGSSQPNGDGASTSRQPASGMKNASASSSGKRAGRKDRDDDVEDVDGGEDEEDEEDEGDAAVQQEIQDIVNNFKDQPIPSDASKRVRGLQAEWTMLAEQFSDVFSKYNNTALQLEGAHSSQPETESEDVKSMDAAFRQLIDAEVEIKAYAVALSSIENSMQRDALSVPPALEYERIVKMKNKEYENQTTRQKYAKNDDYQAFREAIWESRSSGEPMAPLAQTIPREDGDDEDDDDDIVVGGATQDYKCPITLRLFVDPVTSSKCPHSFSREAIYSMFRVPEIRCPQPGCQARFTKGDLRPNKNLESRVKAFARREKERERREREKDDIDMTLDDDED